MINIVLRTITNSGLQVVGYLLGNENSNRLLVCSHGFGVKSDSRGIFTMVKESFKDHFLGVGFHYVSVDDFTGSTFVYEFSTQVQKLLTVIEKVQGKYGKKRITIIGHSQGCLIPSLMLRDHPMEIEKLILLSPSPTTDLVRKMTSYWGNRVGSTVDLNGLSAFSRSDGAITYVPAAFWKEAKTTFPVELFKFVADNYPTYFVRPINDEVVPEKDYALLKALKPKHYFELKNGHDYKEDNRIGLLGLLNKILFE
ncbi:hypothetical protein CO112_02105 [Candidatus Dojkabacteria bacterium CG_4_9_14_3_um_filter_150_Dojkabacteria_WS6_41_13]|uniref:AB hydrolase-1 domain-containing protein n=1 Tax=Candidatus Dojkabacteria bacterium CG_4_10_14_0_2_um_filter_Dojkabacteria_WS6_41_15 TaxID=2014249 RepID=A0A2M7W2A8_9BACT|nr:MAG: hypothetical protein COZ14_04050 [Candidatus Dojkabacteria bacterium CG_4_10_14_3_um_filter_Dojkabacteria_WS6_41_9]PJA13407.1 MAG: hypothetical protein COX64_03420 [Candidatus Dojkabacteria bacterium CG_4_10_14_0_2_um_filter_Dojkabacteria_WS6_41_15]PJB22859.1 MAG: hypothetical protein CO112_02105 [Candidatus Dojkabacteria bacterium CG_4_9_14_3_um_filter_150_Dojkabacteria_WS6_41_13]